MWQYVPVAFDNTDDYSPYVTATCLALYCARPPCSNSESLYTAAPSKVTSDANWLNFGHDARHTSVAHVAGPSVGAVVAWTFQVRLRILIPSLLVPVPVLNAANATVWCTCSSACLYAVTDSHQWLTLCLRRSCLRWQRWPACHQRYHRRLRLDV
jgi:hypothetical protein